MSPPPGCILLFAEDPGAVNCIAPLAHELIHRGRIPLLLSAGHANILFCERGLVALPIMNEMHAVGMMPRLPGGRVVVGTSENPDSPGFALIAAARDAGVPSFGVIDSAANAAFRFRGTTSEALAYAPDWLLVPDQWTAQEYRGLGFPAARIVEVGHPQYDRVAVARATLARRDRSELRGRLYPRAPRGAPIVVFVSEISTGLDPRQYQVSADYTLHGRGVARDRSAIVVEELLDALNALHADGLLDPYLVLRRHPKEQDEALAAYLPHFDLVSRGGDPLELIYAADLAVGMSSMLLIEAHLLGVPTLSIVPRIIERDWLPTVRAGVTPCATDRHTVREWLRTWLAARPEHAALVDAPPPPHSRSSSSAARMADFVSGTAE